MTYVYIYIHGRFGNQLFQYWIAKYIATHLNRELRIFTDESMQIDSNIYTNIDNIRKYI